MPQTTYNEHRAVIRFLWPQEIKYCEELEIVHDHVLS